jgi:arginyl-tRNA synthetase
MTLEDKINEFLTDNSYRAYSDKVTYAAFHVAQGHLDNLYDTREEVGVDADGEDFLSDYYVAQILDRVINELSSMHSVDAEDNAFFVELKAIVDSHNKKASA